MTYVTFFRNANGEAMPADTWRELCWACDYEWSPVLESANHLGYEFNTDFYASLESLVKLARVREIEINPSIVDDPYSYSDDPQYGDIL